MAVRWKAVRWEIASGSMQDSGLHVDKSSRNGDSRADIGKSDGIKTVSTETQESRLQVR